MRHTGGRAIDLGAPRAHPRYADFLRVERGDPGRAERELRAAMDADEEGWGYPLGSLLLDRGDDREAARILAHAANWGDEDARLLLDQEFDDTDGG